MFKNNDLVKIKEEFHNSGETNQLYRVVNVNEATKRCYIEMADCQLPLSPQELVSFDMLHLVHASPTKVHVNDKGTLEDELGTEYTQIANTSHFMSQATGEIYAACRADERGNTVEIEPLYQHLQQVAAIDKAAGTSNLIKAMVAYGLENSWCDSEIIDALVELGITHEDFLKAGAGDFVKSYFEDELEEAPSLDSKIQTAQARTSGAGKVVPVQKER